jgi:fucose 4-O-acetylase-like acetyltransferase
MMADSRVHWLDRAKGVGIVLVVFGHAWLGTQAAGLLPDGAVFRTVETLIYNFHMPLFFLLSGVTFEAAVRRKPLLVNVRDRALRLLWPLLLWTYVFAGFKVLAGSAANSPEGLSGLMIWPLPPRDHLWFLWALFLIQLVALPIAVAGRAPRPGWLWLGMGIGAMALVSIPGLPIGPLTVNAALHLGIFLLGIWLARRGPLPSGLLAGCVALGVFVGVQVLSFGLPVHTGTVQAVAALLCLSFVVVLNTPRGAGGAAGALLETLGRLSMPIYLAHTLFTAASRIVLFKFTDSPEIHLGVGTLAGIIGPILLYHAARRIASPRVFGF